VAEQVDAGRVVRMNYEERS